MLTIWGRKTSSNVQALMWCVGELGLPFRRHDVGHEFGGLDSDTFTALNPNRTIPVVQDNDGTPIWETGAILRYLAARYAYDSFWPDDPVRRATVDKWAEWAKLNVAMNFTVPVFWRVVRTAPSDRDETAITAALHVLEDKLAIADQQLSHCAYIAGTSFTLADIQLGHVLYRYFDIGIPRAPFRHLRRYYETLSARPAYRDHVMINYESLRAH